MEGRNEAGVPQEDDATLHNRALIVGRDGEDEDGPATHPDSGNDEPSEYQMDDDEYDPSEQEIAEYCEWLGMDATKEKVLTWIAREALKAPLPEFWKICYTDDREVYYFNMRTGESIWDHPMDAYYKSLFRQEKAKLEKKRKKMRLHASSMPLTPLQNFFSDLCEGDAAGEEASAAEKLSIPEALCDPIDFMLFVDPVVLPTSGRTVSKHTVVNNRWRDPFTREYVENRRLINNVDKRSEVDQWLAKAVRVYFNDIAFPSELTEWAARVGSVVSPPQKDCTGSFSPALGAQYSISSSLPALLKLLPYLLDKEEETCLEGQRLVLRWVQTAYSLPPPVSRRGSVRCVSDVKALRGGELEVVQAVGQLQDPSLLLRPLLNMSTSASIEGLAIILHHHPTLRNHPCFEDYSPDVLNVLQLNPQDLLSMAGSLSTNTDFPPKTTNSDYLVKLMWCFIILDSPCRKNLLSSLPWEQSFPTLCTACHSLPAVQNNATLVIQMLRGLHQWPCTIANADVVRWLVSVATSADNQNQQVLLLYDLLVNCGETATHCCKTFKSSILQILVAPSPGTSGDRQRASATLGAVLVYSDICRLEEFAPHPQLQMRIARELLPRLTRLQWRPKLFESTVNVIVDLLSARPVEGWNAFQSERTEFLIKELGKKKKGGDDLRAKLETHEAAEKRLQQYTAINNWLLFNLKVKEPNTSPLHRALERREDLLRERAANLAALFRLLLVVRMKVKYPPAAPPPQASAAGVPVPPHTLRRGVSVAPPQKLPAALAQTHPRRGPNNITARNGAEKEASPAVSGVSLPPI